MGIRRIAPEQADLRTLEYAFTETPMSADGREKWRSALSYSSGCITLIAEEDGVSVAEATAIPMRQNVRGAVHPMGGVAAVAAQPQVRRRGYVKKLMLELLGQLRDEGHVLSALYPFRASFYGKFGYVGLPKPRCARFDPAGLSELQNAELPGDIEFQPISEGYPSYRAMNEQLLTRRHGFSVFPDFRDVRIRDRDERWLVTAKSGDEVIGVLPYHITKHDKTVLKADCLLYTSVLGRTLLLQFLARHIDHIEEVVVPVAPDEFPELWATDLAVQVDARRTMAAAPMCRVLSVEALQGMPVGPGRVGVEIVDDPFIAGKYVLDGTSGQLEITSGDPEIALTAAGFAGLVYGVLSPDEIVLRGLGTVSKPDELAKLFPKQVPYLYANF